MQIAIGDIWTKMSDDSSAVCVTTNGVWKKNGLAVMGKGIAKDADVRYQVSSQLGKNLRKHGNHVCDLGRHISPNGHSFTMLAFPTKQHWKNPSDIRLIRRSAEELVALTNTMGFSTVFLTPPGCSLGGLDWEHVVYPVLKPLLDDRFVVLVRKS